LYKPTGKQENLFYWGKIEETFASTGAVGSSTTE
jgi:hypothetical protein